MSRGREFGANLFGGAIATQDMQRKKLQERINKLAAENYDFASDPCFIRNHLGTIDCRLCGTVHPNEASYLGHIASRRHTKKLKQRQLAEQQKNLSFLSKQKQTQYFFLFNFTF